MVELEPKITTLGANLDESLTLQKQHDETLRNIQVSRVTSISMQSKQEKKKRKKINLKLISL